MNYPLLPTELIYSRVQHNFLRLPGLNRSGFKTISVVPLDEDTCGMVIDLDGENTERSMVRVRVENKDALRIAGFVSTQPLVDIIATKEKDESSSSQVDKD
jgi:hypothetical protein